MEQPGIDTLGGTQPDATGASDERLLSAFIEGDETMFSELVHRYEKPLYAFISRIIGETGDASDLFQETFVRVYQNAGSFRSESRFKTWLYAIAANLCRSRIRKQRREASVSIEDAARLSASRPGPPGALDAKEIGRRVAGAVRELPLEQGEVVVLRVYEEMSYAEIADALERPLGTVKSQMRRAVTKLRGSLRDIAKAYGIA